LTKLGLQRNRAIRRRLGQDRMCGQKYNAGGGQHSAATVPPDPPETIPTGRAQTPICHQKHPCSPQRSRLFT